MNETTTPQFVNAFNDPEKLRELQARFKTPEGTSGFRIETDSVFYTTSTMARHNHYGWTRASKWVPVGTFGA